MTDIPTPEGTHGAGSTDEDRLGPAILLAGGEPTEQPRVTIVVGVAEDESSDAALAFAVDLAGRLAARLAVVHVIGIGDYPIDPDTADWEQQAQTTLAAERTHVQRAAAGHRFGWTYQARHGSPVAVLATAADEHDAYLVVVGRHGHTIGEQLRRLLDGSVSHQLLNQCGRPVLVVPTEH